MNYIKNLVLIAIVGLCFQFGYWQFMLGAGIATILLILRDIRDSVESAKEEG